MQKYKLRIVDSEHIQNTSYMQRLYAPVEILIQSLIRPKTDIDSYSISAINVNRIEIILHYNHGSMKILNIVVYILETLNVAV